MQCCYREHYDQHVFSERNVVSTEVGEIVAVRYDNDDWWYRARVVGTSTAGKIKVHVDGLFRISKLLCAIS